MITSKFIALIYKLLTENKAKGNYSAAPTNSVGVA